MIEFVNDMDLVYQVVWWRKELVPKHAQAVLVDNKLVGMVVIDRMMDSYFIRYIAVARGMQNKGYGSMIIKKIEEDAKKEGFGRILVKPLPNAVRFYEKNGFRKGERDFYVKTV